MQSDNAGCQNKFLSEMNIVRRVRKLQVVSNNDVNVMIDACTSCDRFETVKETVALIIFIETPSRQALVIRQISKKHQNNFLR